jgi:hypothetical protein
MKLKSMLRTRKRLLPRKSESLLAGKHPKKAPTVRSDPTQEPSSGVNLGSPYSPWRIARTGEVQEPDMPIDRAIRVAEKQTNR